MNDFERKPRRRWLSIGCLLLCLAPVAMCAPFCWVMRSAGSGAAAVPERVVLEFDLRADLSEEAGAASLASFGDEPPTVRSTVEALARAQNDPRVTGLFVAVGAQAHGMAVALELHDALLRFRQSGKPVVAFAESIGEFAPGTGGYLVASACSRIVVQPLGQVSLQGLSMEEPFARRAFDELGVQAHFAARREFKNAINVFTENEPTAPQREASLALLSSFEKTLSERMSAARIGVDPSLTPARMLALLHDGPYSAVRAKELKLIDDVGFRDEARAQLTNANTDVSFLWLHRYAERADVDVNPAATTVAVVTIAGEIQSGAPSVNPLSGGPSGAFSIPLAKAIRQARLDEDVRALLIRVDSPGGSVVASQTIAREIDLAQQAGKKVVVSMGNLAASGGYWVAAKADRIVAQPGTITGSIGVFAGKFITEKLWDRLGVNWVTTATDGTDATLASTDSDFSPAALAKLEGFVDEVYSTFIARVAQGRKLDPSAAEALARGRIWSGSDAKDRGLVDALGGYDVAMNEVRAQLTLAADAPLSLVAYPRSQTTWERVLSFTVDNADNSDDADAHAQPWLLPWVQQEAQAWQAWLQQQSGVRAHNNVAPVRGMQ
jgi:protease IV